MPGPLEFTGERFTPECVREIWYEHLHRYAFAAGLVHGLKVLDAACGEGYGSALLAKTASSVTGVDIAAETIEHARERYAMSGLEYRQCDCLDLPFADDTFDCVVSFETLEHLEEQDRLLREFERVLTPQGFVLLSTPDKAVYTDRQRNRNEFHARELYRPELEALLADVFPAHRFWGQKLLFHSALWSLETLDGVRILQEQDGAIRDLASLGHDPVYFVVIGAREQDHLPVIDHGLNLFDDAAGSVHEHYQHEIRKNMAAGAVLAAKEQEIEALRSELAAGKGRAHWWRRLFGR